MSKEKVVAKSMNDLSIVGNEITIDGDLEIDFSINDLNLSLNVLGSIYIKSFLVIKKIKAGGGIEAGDWIEAGGGIEAKYVLSLQFYINCHFLKTTLLPFWRNFYAQMPPLRKFSDEIMGTKCWDDLRELILPNAEEVCAWDGWHPILRAQLKMFFRLCEKVEWSE